MTNLSIKLHNIHRPKEYMTFLETHFRDAVLDYEPDPARIKHLFECSQYDRRYMNRKGRDAIKKFITSKEKANLKVEWNFD